MPNARAVARLMLSPALLALIAAPAVAAEPASQPSRETPWPTVAELAATLSGAGYRLGAASSHPGGAPGGVAGQREDLAATAGDVADGSVHIDGAADSAALVRLVVGDDGRLAELWEIGSTVGVPGELLSAISSRIQGVPGSSGDAACSFAEWPLPQGRLVLWQDGSGTDYQVALVPATIDASGSGPLVPATADEACALAEGAGAPLTVVVDARDLWFEPAELKLPAGRPVTLVLENKGRVAHNLTIDALGVLVVAAAGGTSEVALGELAPGTYEYSCSVSGHDQAGMHGVLTVE